MTVIPPAPIFMVPPDPVLLRMKSPEVWNRRDLAYAFVAFSHAEAPEPLSKIALSAAPGAPLGFQLVPVLHKPVPTWKTLSAPQAVEANIKPMVNATIAVRFTMLSFPKR